MDGGMMTGEGTAGPLAGPDAVLELPPRIGRERRLHARAYDYWISLLGGRRCPRIADLDPARLAQFAPNSVLVELPGEQRPPAIRFLGRTLAGEAGLESEQPALDEVPRLSLLGQLIRRLPAIRGQGTPLGFEAEFLGQSGAPTLYRGILLPFADDGGAVSMVMGVINWKLLATGTLAPDIVAAVDSAFSAAPKPPMASAWGDGPGAAAIAPEPETPPLAQRLAAARTWAALAVTDRVRRQSNLSAALSAVYDVLLSGDGDRDGLEALFAEAGLSSGSADARALRLIFGADLARSDRVRFAAVLGHARRLGLGPGMLAAHLERHPDGVEGFAAAGRRARRAERSRREVDAGRAWLASAPALGRIKIAPLDAEFLLLVGRRAGDGVEIVAQVADDGGLAAHALRRVAG